ncbi:DUF1524 domain-containing protein [Rhodococcus sp. HNM0563]|uniref:GmrSD restriction endonuclease domain-containing protein n=1 Tax=unclassified Rhodococcus (in: high G+C Gram-positive bacteria) TaxID=192944 RepID=UPI00146B2525|nr:MULTISPECIES: DUF1524 domain-containing protein [unclassified Rhodococcus (in: high G+C Gram-positive bacteria)]MCK0093630.1 DUF1524 domain-containing protein [Rhodococcus sp. F64268]NLU65345.1 DUF1524 domain-containing protein [Rhodococcus sp. HNM0563]
MHVTGPIRSRAHWAAVIAAAVVFVAGCTDVTGDVAPELDHAASTGTSSVEPTVTPTVERSAASPSSTAASPVAELPADLEDSGEAGAALAQLSTLPIKGRAPKTGYDRDLFGQAWSDDVSVAGGHNGCDTRNDILARDLVDIAYKPGTRDCVVLSGTLNDTYTGTSIAFTRGQDTSTAVQIDHVVALSDAWQKGAQQLDAQTRADFANDPRNLQAVDGPINQQKSDGDAATWLPPNNAYRCTYVARQVQVKAAYNLWVTQAEHDAMVRVLTSCGGSAPVAQPSKAVVVPTTTIPAPQPVPAATTAAPQRIQPQPTPEPVPVVEADPGSVYYQNCAAARAAGAAPLYVGEPGYRPKMDGDNDGVACE